MGDVENIMALKELALLLGPGGTLVFAGFWWLERKERRVKENNFILHLDKFIEANQKLSEAINSLRIKTGG